MTLATEKYIERYFTPTLVARQVSALNESSTSDSSSFEGLTIKASATSSVVTAIYEVEDATLEMVIRIPSNFPLRQVEIESGGGSRVGVPENKWRGWLLSSTAVLIAQNGTLADAVAVFRKNITSHFEGVEVNMGMNECDLLKFWHRLTRFFLLS